MKSRSVYSALAGPLFGAAFLSPLIFVRVARPQQTTSGPSIAETIMYINSHSSRTVVSVSSDKRDLVMQRDVHACGKNGKFTCGSYYDLPLRYATQAQVLANRKSVWISGGLHEAWVHTINNDKETRSEPSSPDTVMIADNLDDEEMADRVKRATEHLLEVLVQQLEKENERRRDPNDPFQKP